VRSRLERPLACDPVAVRRRVAACREGISQPRVPGGGLDEKRLAAEAGGAKCKRADADQAREATGFPIGGVPPFGHATPLRVFVDRDLLGYGEVWAAAGTWNDVFPVEPHALVTATKGAVTDIKKT